MIGWLWFLIRKHIFSGMWCSRCYSYNKRTWSYPWDDSAYVKEEVRWCGSKRTASGCGPASIKAWLEPQWYDRQATTDSQGVA